MKIRRTILIVLLLLTISVPVPAWAVPACSQIQTYTQPDNTTISFRNMGDEHFNWKETPQGDVIFYDKASKYYCYGQLRNNKAVASDARVGVDHKPFVRLTGAQLLSAKDYSIRHSISLGSQAESTAVPSLADRASTAPITLSPTQHLLVLLIDFSNVKIKQSDAYWSQKFFGPSGSVDNYYDEVSQGKLAFTPVAETSGTTTNDGILRATLPTEHPAVDGYQNTNEMYDQILATVETALESEAGDITNLAAYDTNHDGILETDELHLVTIFAGFEASASGSENPVNAIWAHTYSGGFGDLGDGLMASGYIATGEMKDATTPMTIGVFCHELGHSLGLPDLYDYGGISVGLGVHSLMASGSWGTVGNNPAGSSPTHLDAWSEIQLGFTDPQVIQSGGAYALYGSMNPSRNVIRVNTSIPSQYFLLEYRTFDGYDAGLQREAYEPGVAIYHVDEAMIANAVDQNEASINENRFRKGVDFEEANQNRLKYSELDNYETLTSWFGDQYFTGIAGMNIFGPDTNPSSGLYDKTVTAYYSEISSNGTQNIPSDVRITVNSLAASTAAVNIALAANLTASVAAEVTYTGSAQTPAVTVKSNGLTLAQGTDYTLQYKNNIMPGKATAIVTGTGAYAGLTVTKYFVILPKSLTSMELALDETYPTVSDRYRTVKASWPAAFGASGYSVAYRSDADSQWSYALVSGNYWKKTLDAGKKYYVKVRPYVTLADSTKHYSTAYSPTEYTRTLKAPGLALAKYGVRSVKVTLGNVYSESAYQIYRASSSGGTYYYKKTVAANTAYWIDSSTETGKTYYYKVRVYKWVNGIKVYGPFSSVRNIAR